MIWKSVKVLAVSALGLTLVGGILFGTELGSYVRSSARSVRTAVKDSVPLDFELKRARDMIEDIIPEMHANIRTIAQQEVEIATLKTEIVDTQKALAEEQARVQKVRDCLATSQVSFIIGGINYTRDNMKEELSRRFDRYKEAEVVLAGKRRLLDNRERSLKAAVDMLERTRSQKAMLENQIASLEAQYKLVQAAAVGSNTGIDTTKLAQTQKLIGQIKKQLDVAERTLAHEAKFTQPMEINVIDEGRLMAEVDEHFGVKKEPAKVAEEQALTRAESMKETAR